MSKNIEQPFIHRLVISRKKKKKSWGKHGQIETEKATKTERNKQNTPKMEKLPEIPFAPKHCLLIATPS
jgi:hypothetical protein